MHAPALVAPRRSAAVRSERGASRLKRIAFCGLVWRVDLRRRGTDVPRQVGTDCLRFFELRGLWQETGRISVAESRRAAHRWQIIRA